jgi:hypothetical protein
MVANPQLLIDQGAADMDTDTQENAEDDDNMQT